MRLRGVPGLRLAVNFAVLSGAEFISKAAAALAFAFLARVLGPESYGQLEFALAVIFFFILIVDTGLGVYGAREVARDGVAIPRLVVHITFLRGLLALASCAVLLVAALLIDQPAPVKRLLVFYGVTLFGLPGLLAWLFQGRDLMRYVAIASVLRWSIFTAGVFLLVRGADQLWLVPVLEALALGCVTLFYLTMYARRFGLARSGIDVRLAGSILRQSLPIGASELVWAVKVFSATVLLQVLVSGPGVGWYAAALRVVVSLHTFVWLYFFNLLPSLSRNAAISRPSVRRVIDPSLQVVAWSAVFIGIAGTALAGPAVLLLYGAEYSAAVGPLQVLIWAIPLTLMSGHYRYTLLACGQQKLEFLAAAVGAIVNVGLNLLLIPAFSVQGAAWSLILSEVIIWVVAYAFVHRTVVSISVWPALRMPLLAGGLMLGTVQLLVAADRWVSGGVALLVYVLVLMITEPAILTHARSLLADRRAPDAITS